jgi:pyruvate/2-oxoglutarate dehydrogenase complex dihydrolipoamide dehydrogenase (E3) component
MPEDVDAIVLGMGPGGEEVAGWLAEAGLAVVGIEAKLLGGECPYWGCVPTKMMIRAADLLAEARRIPGMAGDSTVRSDWAAVARRIRDEATDTWDDQVAVDRFVGKGGRFIRGHGRITAPGEVTVDDGHVFRARRAIVVAIGTEPSAPPIPGLADVPYWTNRDAVEAEQLPRSLIVLGGGAVGAELAQVFARFGVTVTVVEAADRLLPPEEPEVGELLYDVFTCEGIAVYTGAHTTKIHHEDGAFRVEMQDGNTLAAERLLVATGRRADLAATGIGTVGIDEQARAVPVDERMRVTDGVWAVGDVTGKGAFTHVAMYQAAIAVPDILGEPGPPANYRAVPRVTFTDPEVGSVGLTEQAARDAGLRVRVGTTQLPNSARGWIQRPATTASSNSSRTPTVACSSARPRSGRWAAR